MTQKYYAVEVYDNTCNEFGHQSGIYGKNDYSWVTETLNGGNANIDMTKEEAEEVKADFERVIKEKNLEWASVEIIEIEVELDDED